MPQTLHLVKIGGNVIDSPQALDAFLNHFAQLQGPKVLVHGGGKIATRLAEKLGLEVKMLNGRRITDRETLDVTVMVYGGLVNKNIVAALQAKGCTALGLAGADLDAVYATRRPVKDGIDYGLVGDVQAVNAEALQRLLVAGFAPVMAPLSHDRQGQLLNTNADTIASETAVALAAFYDVRLLFCFEKKGVLAKPDDDESVIGQLTPQSYAHYKAEGVVSGGMLPKLDNAFNALARGVREVVILQAEALPHYGQPHFTGTRIIPE